LELNEYKALLIDTISETYPKYLREKVVKKLVANNIVSTSPDLLSTAEVTLDGSDKNHFDQIVQSIEQNQETIRHIEELEYDYSYKYAALFNHNSVDLDSTLADLLIANIINNTDSDTFSFDFCSAGTETDRIIPSFKEINDDIYCLKFCKKITGYLPISGDNQRIVKYPIVVLLYKNEKVIEIRFDKIKGFLKNGDEFFYIKQIQWVSSWLGSKLGLELEAMNLSPIIEYTIPKETNDESSEVVVTAQAMNLASGSKAILDTGVNDQFVLPLLGELKNLIRDNEELFNSNKETKEIKSKLSTFILETEESSHLPWILLTWKNETKSKAVKVKFSFNYLGQEFSLLQYYGSNAEMERMNNVTKYLIQNQREYLNQESE
jgi:hypothetical protein